MSITPNNNVFTALSLADIAKPLSRAAAQGIQRPADDGAKFRQAVKQNTAETEDGGNAPRQQQQVAEDFRREAVSPRRPTYQRMGQLVDLSI